jgi:UDPglucose 6-dehydrogenase
MQIGVFGSGYLATVIAACLADFGTPVTVFDEDSARVMALAEGEIPFYERNLKDIVRRNLRSGRLCCSTELSSFARRSQIIYFAGENHTYIEEIALKLASEANGSSTLVISTPVPVGTARRVEQRLRSAGRKMTVVSQPLFLTDGCAVEDFNWPDRLILGTDSTQAVALLKQLYRPLVMRGVPVIVTNHQTAELVREASTAFVATKISFINELASLCEHVSADAMDLAVALGLDKKISPRCLQPGAGFGGPFVETDMDSLAQLAAASNVQLKILSAAREVNRSHSDRVIEKLSRVMQPVAGKEVGLLGLSYKPNTSSVAASSSIELTRRLLARGARVRAYDPAALVEAKSALNGSVQYCESAYEAAQGTDALVVSTAWPEFRSLDFSRIRTLVRTPVIVDTKNLLDAQRLRGMGFEYVGIGRA